MHTLKILPALVILASIGSVIAQDATTTNPLNNFIGAVQSGASQIQSANAQQTTSSASSSATSSTSSPSSTSSTPSPTSSPAAAAASKGLSKGALIGIIVGAIVAALILLALLICLCCCVFRRRKRSKRAHGTMTDEEVRKFRSPAANPGRQYSPVHNGRPSMEQHPAMPLMAAAAMPNGGHGREPSLSQHPALRDGHRDHHLGRDAALVGAGGLAAHEAGKHHGHKQTESVGTTGGLPPPTPPSSHHLGRDAGLTGVAGAGAYGTGKHHHGHHQPTAMGGGLGNNSTYGHHDNKHHLGRDAGLAGAGGLAAYEAEKHHHSHNQPLGMSGGLNSHSTPHSNNPLARDTGLAGAGAGGVTAYEAEKHHHGRNQPTNVTGLDSNSTPRSGHHLGRDVGLVGAGGLAAHEANRHHPNNTGSTGTTAGLGQSPTTNTGSHHLGRDAGLAGAGGLAAHEAGNHHSGFQPAATTGGLNSSTAHPGSHHYGRDAGLAGAGGLAAYEAEKHHHGRNQPGNTISGTGSHATPFSETHQPHTSQAGAHDSAVSSGTGVAGIGGTGLAAHEVAKHHHEDQPASAQAPPAYGGGLGSHPTGHTNSSHHHARDTGLAGAGGVAAYEAEKHHQNNKRASKIENPFVPRPPSPRRSAPNSRLDSTEATTAGVVSEDPGRRSRSNSRPRSGLPVSHRDPNRPPTPFGLNSIGQPYEDMHVHELVTAPPSKDLQQSLHNRDLNVGALAAGAEGHNHPENRRSRGYATPPEVPSRSPNRAKHASAVPTDSSYDSSISSSGAEQYQRHSDPYAPGQRESVAPWESQGTRYSGSSPTAADMAPPPVPWDGADYVHQHRRQSHSPRQSMSYEGRRKSRSPATSINGQPRRLRFEDLQSAGEVPPTPTAPHAGGYAPVTGHDSYDGYNHARWSQGVGEAM